MLLPQSGQLPRPLLLLLLSTVTSNNIAHAKPASSIFSRADTCEAQKLQSCPSGLPVNFCCPKDFECVSLAGDTTALCCPSGKSCNTIQPITCNIREQDPAEKPTAPIKTTVFDVDLEACGTKTCCPFGYSCSSNQLCQKNKDQSLSPKDKAPSSSSASTTVPSATSTQVDVPSSTSTSEPTSSTTSAAGSKSSEEENNNSKMISIIGGAVGGCLVLLLIAVVGFLYLRRNRRRNMAKATNARPNPPGPGPFGNIISEPILQSNSYRTDFILKSTPTESPAMTNIDRRSRFSNRIRSKAPRISIPNPFDSPNPSASSPTHTRHSYASNDDNSLRQGHVVNARLAPIRAMKASSTHSRRPTTQHVGRDPGSESINVFADPSEVGSIRGDRRYTQATTFSDLMDEAQLSDVHRGKAYVPGTTPKI